MQVALVSGLLGISLFSLLFALPIIRLRRLAKQLGAAQLGTERDICNLMVVVLLGFGLLLGTISLVGVLPQYIFLLIGISAGIATSSEAALEEQKRA